MGNKLEKKYGLFTAICMVVGIVIGSGVFFKAQTVLTKTNGNMPLGILAWLIGGVIMLCCVLTFCEHGTRSTRRSTGLLSTLRRPWGVRMGIISDGL